MTNYLNVLNILSDKQLAYLAQDASEYMANETSKGFKAWSLLCELCETDYERVYPIARAYCNGFNY